MDNEIELDRYLNNQLAYTRALANAKVYSSSEGDKNSMIELKKIDPKNVKFMGMKNIEKENGLIFEKSHFEILLPNGERTILTVDKNGNDMSCDFIDENGKSQKFLLTPRMQSEIMKNCVNGKITGNVDMNLIQEALFPESQEDMEKEIPKDAILWDADIIQIPHHGYMAGIGSEALYQATKPEYALLDCTVEEFENNSVNIQEHVQMIENLDIEVLKRYDTEDGNKIYIYAHIIIILQSLRKKHNNF